MKTNQQIKSLGSSVKSIQSFTIRKKIKKTSKTLQKNTFILLFSTILTLCLTNCITNLILLLNIFLCFPYYKDNNFRLLLSIGISFGILLQPNQFIYFILLIIMIFIRGQDMQFPAHSHWVAIQVSRVVVLFSKVSVINFVIGLFESSKLVMVCIAFRIIMNYFNIISVFMGTQETYNQTYFNTFIPKSILIDVMLYSYMILLKLYSPNFVYKFSNTSITNIFLQYPILQRIQITLNILKVIQLLSYIVIQINVLASRPSIIILIRLILHVIIASVHLLKQNPNQTLKNLWKMNLYTSLFIVFFKYFYLLNRYQNLSNWLITILQPIQNNWQLLGLWQANNENIFELVFMFVPDFCIIVLSMIVQFTLDVKIYQNYRSIILAQENFKIIQQKSENNSNKYNNQVIQSQNKINLQNQIIPKVNKNIKYLYKNYIQQASFKFTSTSFIGNILGDFLYDVYFTVLCFVYFFLQDPSQPTTFWLALPHFIIAFIVFISQQDRRIPCKSFIYSIIYSFLTILFLYMSYLKKYINHNSYDDIKNSYEINSQSQQIFKLSDILHKYILFLFGCFFYKLHIALKQQFLSSNKNITRKNNIIFTLLMPVIQKNFGFKFLREISILYINFFKSAILALFISNFFTNITNSIFNIFSFFYLIIVINKPHWLGYLSKQDTLKIYWIHPILLSYLLSLWNSSFIGYVGILIFRFYIIFYMEYQLHIDFLFCQYVTQTQKHLIEQVDRRFNNIKTIDKMSIIPEEKEGLSKISFASENTQDDQKWYLKNTYKTLITFIPHFCLFYILFSQLLLYKNIFIGFLSIILLSIIFLNIKFYQNKWILNDHMKKLIQTYFILSFVANFIQFQQQQIIQHKKQAWYKLGIFFLCLGYFFYVYLTFKIKIQSKNIHYKDLKNNNNSILKGKDKDSDSLFLIPKCFKIDFLQNRTNQAIQYWKIKSQFISQLGAQIHNQKKLIKLRKYYVTKQNISRKVQTLIQQIQKRGKNNEKNKNTSVIDFELIDKILDFKDEDTHYQLFSNMLITLSLEDLQYCLQMLNHYYKRCTKMNYHILYKRQFEDNQIQRISSSNNSILDDFKNINTQITNQIKEIRQNVLNIYHGSVYLAFKQYKRSKIAQQIYQNQKHQQQILNNNITQQKQLDIPQKQQISSSLSDSDSQQYINLQKMVIMNEKNTLCIERIHKKSMEISWIWRKVIQNFQIISLVIVTGWNFFGGVYTIPTNIAIFSWAIVLQSKTTVIFWSFILIYTGFIMFLKFCLPSIASYAFLEFIFYYYPKSCFYQYLIILVSCFQIILIKIGGTQTKAYSQRQSIYDSFYRKCLNKATHKIQSPLQSQFIQVYKTLSQPSKHSFIYRVFSKSRLKPGKDFYPIMSGIQLIILLYIFFFYDMMEFQSRNNRKSLEQILTVNQFSKNMMIALFSQSIIMIIDRCIVSLNLIDTKNQALQNFFLNFAFSDRIKYRAPDDVTHVGFFDFLLIIKYIFHIFLLISINFFVYFYIPSSGFKKSLIPQCSNVICGKSYTFLSIFLLLYLGYFLVSGLQIKHGFNRDKCKNKLMEKYHYVNYYIYVLFTGIPFLWQFKKICDWTITTTSLPLFHWMKFQDINARLYQSKCEAEMLKIKPRGRTPLSKYFIGPTGCIFILCLVFSPLIIYSSLNPFAIKDQVIASKIKLSLLVNNTVEYKLFSTSHSIIKQQPNQYFQTINHLNNTTNTYNNKFKQLINFQDYKQFYLQMSSYPDENFKLSQPTIQKLISRIDRQLNGKKYRTFDIVLYTKIIQKEGGQRQFEYTRKRLNKTELLLFKQFLSFQYVNQMNNNNITNNNKIKSFKLQNFYTIIPGQKDNQTICIITRNNGEYYQLFLPVNTQSCQLQSNYQSNLLNNDQKNDQENFLQNNQNKSNITNNQYKQNPGILLFYKSSTKYKIGFGLITFYVTYVLLISRLFRVYLTGNLQNVIYEGCQLQRMLILCDAVRQARILQNLYEQEYLYAFLVDLMRTPRTLKEMSGNFTQLREKLPLNL